MQGKIKIDSKRHVMAQLQTDNTFLIVYRRLAHISELESLSKFDLGLCNKRVFKEHFIYQMVVCLSREAVAATEFLVQGILREHFKNKTP